MKKQPTNRQPPSLKPIDNNTGFLRQTITDLSEQLDLLTMLQDMSSELISRFDFDEIITLFLNIVRDITGYSGCIVYLRQNGQTDYRPVRCDGIAEALLHRYHPDNSIISWVLAENRWTQISLPNSPAARKTDVTSILPIQGAHKPLGFALLISAAEHDMFTQATMKLLNFAAGQTGVALENQNLYARLQRSHNFIENIVESINSGILTIDKNDMISLINNNAVDMLGLPTADILNRPYRQALPKKLAALITRTKNAALREGCVIDAPLNYVPAKNSSLPLAVTATRLKNTHKTGSGIIFVFRDISASRELERLRQLDEMKTDFVSSVSHELRTPLSIIKSYVEAILNQVDPDNYQVQREFLHVVNSETDRLARLVDDLLDISRIEAGHLELEHENVRIDDIIQQVWRTFDNSHTNPITIDIPQPLPVLQGDHDKLVRVFVNLLDNAMKFSPANATIHIHAAVKGKYLFCAISDPGTGIARADLPHIFEKFFRSEQARRNETPGTGLGLSIVKHIIEAHQGKIKVKSTAGKGTTFTLQLPLSG
ncbi:MAG: PAS domain-containing protein [Deltaproteobacteria bacterium]|nr:PAS domain-containing protein [Deltaproteobacteria bacterium]